MFVEAVEMAVFTRKCQTLSAVEAQCVSVDVLFILLMKKLPSSGLVKSRC